MNINKYLPKHVNLEEAKARAIKYEGTFTELYNLVEQKRVTLVVNSAGDVNGIYVDSGAGDMMMDELAGQNFSAAFGCKPFINWLEIITDAVYGRKDLTNIDEVRGTCLIDGEIVTFDSSKSTRDPEDCCSDRDLPESEEIDLDDLESDDLKSVRKYLKKKYGYCLAKGHQPNIETDEDENTVYVSDIQWGRKLSDSEMEEL